MWAFGQWDNPVGKRQHMFIDNDIVAWLSSQDKDYQKLANEILRREMNAANQS